ncbi:MAG: beta-1,6-N-acetylglucosaminyltransferase [Thermoanaerobaculia bacterium]
MPPIVCWFVQSHRDPQQILRLLRTIRRGSDGPIFLRHDSDALALGIAVEEELETISGLHQLAPSGPQRRGTFSGQLQPFFDLLSYLEAEDVSFDWLINLTAQDYPVTPVDRIEEFLAASTADGFVRWWDVLGDDSPWSRRKARARYWYRYIRLPARSVPILRLARILTRFAPLHFYLDYGALVGIRRIHVPFAGEFRCCGGRSWWTLRRSAVRRLTAFLRANPRIEKHYRSTVAPEESLIQTVLANARDLAIVNDDYRYVDYSGAVRGSPRTLTALDLPNLASGKYHFARKFDFASSRELLDRIDDELLRSGK